jgi:hypothetical protein
VTSFTQDRPAGVAYAGLTPGGTPAVYSAEGALLARCHSDEDAAALAEVVNALDLAATLAGVALEYLETLRLPADATPGEARNYARTFNATWYTLRLLHEDYP